MFKMREAVAGSRKAPQEFNAVKDAQTDDLVVSNDKIKQDTIEHVVNSFKNNEPEEDLRPVVKVINELHVKRMDENNEDEEPMEVTKEELDDTVSKFKKKNKRSYGFLVKAGDKFHNSVFMLSRRIIQEEEIPERFSETVLHQLRTNKFSKKDLKIHRFIHIKDWLPRCIESLIVGKMKAPILKAGSKYQIGGLPHHRVEEHLVAIKAIVSRSCNTPNGGATVKLVDIKGFSTQ